VASLTPAPLPRTVTVYVPAVAPVASTVRVPPVPVPDGVRAWVFQVQASR